MRALLSMLAVPVLVALSAPARADESHALAEALFQAGKAMMAEGSYDEACAKLTESQRLEPGGGTLLLLGICHEHQQKFATAFAELRSAQSLARRDRRPDREKLAAKHLADVEPRVSTIVVRTKDAGASLVLDGTPLSAQAAERVPLPIDPGAHTLEVSARGKRTRATSFTIGRAAETRTIDVPALEDAPAPAPPPPPPRTAPGSAADAPRDRGGTTRVLGLGLAGAGVVAIGVGAFFGVRALDANASAKDLCDPSRCSNRDAIAKNDDARTDATVADVTIGLGIVAVGAGVAMVLLAPRGADVARAPGRVLATANGASIAF